MYVCMYVCMYVYVTMYVCMYVCMYVYVFMYIMYVHVCMYVYMYVCFYMYVCMCVFMYVCLYVCVNVCIYVKKYVLLHNYYLRLHDIVPDTPSPNPKFPASKSTPYTGSSHARWQRRQTKNATREQIWNNTMWYKLVFHEFMSSEFPPCNKRRNMAFFFWPSFPPPQQKLQ